MADFAGLDLHGATLEHLSIDWAAGRCVAALRRADGEAVLAVRITWTDIHNVNLTWAKPWGPSARVLDARLLAEGLDEFIMQSGDVIRVRAGARRIEEVP